MSSQSADGKAKHIFWMVAACALLVLLGYNLYTGRTIEEIGIGSIGTVKFGKGDRSPSPPPRVADAPVDDAEEASAPLVPEQAAKSIDHEEMARRQAELEDKLRRMEDALKHAEVRPAARAPVEETTAGSPVARHVSIAGTWRDPAGTSWVVHQNGAAVTFQEINPLFGVTAVGQGTLSGRQLQLTYQSAMQTSGQVTLMVSGDGQSLHGNAHDLTTGVTFPLSFSR